VSSPPTPQASQAVAPLEIKKGTEIKNRYVFSDVLSSGVLQLFGEPLTNKRTGMSQSRDSFTGRGRTFRGRR
jgi:hypothetical protein